MKRKVLFSVIALTLVALVALPLFGACAKPAPPTKDKIRIGISTSLTGPLALVRKLSYTPTYELWVEEVNANGGIYVAEYGKKLPIEMVVYDDKSDAGMMTRLLEKLILEDKVDFILAPSGTAMLFAAAPIANKYGYILMGAEGGATSLKEIIAGLPYFFSVLNFADHQMPVLANIFAEAGVKTAAITFNEDLHGIEYSRMAVPEFALKGIDVIFVKSHPIGIKDLSPLLKEAQAANVDAFCGFAYPEECILATAQSMEIGFNPKVFFLTVGPYAPFFRDIFTANGVEGMMGGGAWNPKSSPGAKEFYDKYVARYGEEPNYWGSLMFWSAHQFLQQAIEKAGTLDQKKVRDVMATETFDTAWGPFRFECPVPGGGGLVPAELYPGNIGQWQKGVFEVIDPGAKRTAAPEYPKPAWPAPPK